MSNYSLRFFLLLFLVASATFAQGGDLLIQQYSKGPSLGQSYSKWSLYAGTEINRINTDLSTSSPTITLGALFHLEYRISKSVGLVTGANFTPISYSYPVSDSLGKDQLNQISGIPALNKSVSVVLDKADTEHLFAEATAICAWRGELRPLLKGEILKK